MIYLLGRHRSPVQLLYVDAPKDLDPRFVRDLVALTDLSLEGTASEVPTFEPGARLIIHLRDMETLLLDHASTKAAPAVPNQRAVRWMIARLQTRMGRRDGTRTRVQDQRAVRALMELRVD